MVLKILITLSLKNNREGEKNIQENHLKVEKQ